MYSRVYPLDPASQYSDTHAEPKLYPLRLTEVNGSLCILRSSKVQVKNLDSIFQNDKGPSLC